MTKNSAVGFAAISLCLIAASLLYIPSNNKTQTNTIDIRQNTVLLFNTTKDLLTHFESINYNWPIEDKASLPKTIIRSIPADAKNIRNSNERKALFIRVMLPVILAEQYRIRSERQMLELLLTKQNGQLTNLNDASIKNNKTIKDKLDKLFKEYKIKSTLTFSEKSRDLLNRFDELPLTLILAQAAIESGWGTSRFTRVGNSLFGEWTYQKGAGILPQNREAGKSHQIKAFSSLQGSIASYIKNINRNNAYKELRTLRTEMRLKQQTLDSRKLADGLHRYSQKGQDYVVSLKKILNSKEFRHLESLKLDGK